MNNWTTVSIIVFFMLISCFGYGQISIHSVTTNRMPSGDNGYTLDGHRMVDSRSKLLNSNNFGPNGIYPKSVNIYDEYQESGSVETITNESVGVIFFFGSFQHSNSSLIQFTQSELDSLYQWSKRGGKCMIAAGSSEWNLDILDETWGFSVKQAWPSFFIPTEVGFNTTLFNGPFGTVQSSSQGGGAQGYFELMPENSSVLATDSFGRPTLIIDCTTMDLIAADVDGFTNYNQSQGAQIVNEKDRFFANIFAFMDQVEDPPLIFNDQSVLSTSTVGNVQWYMNDSPIDGATGTTYFPTQYGTYRVVTESLTGCANSSAEIIIDTIFELDDSSLFPNVFTPNGDGVNDFFEPLVNFIHVNSISIYSRWGKLIYTSTEPILKWDGITNSGAMASSGTYYYVVHFSGVATETKVLHGTMTVLY